MELSAISHAWHSVSHQSFLALLHVRISFSQQVLVFATELKWIRRPSTIKWFDGRVELGHYYSRAHSHRRLIKCRKATESQLGRPTQPIVKFYKHDYQEVRRAHGFHQVLVYPTLTDAPPWWLQPALTLTEEFFEEDSEEKESISSCYCIHTFALRVVFLFALSPAPWHILCVQVAVIIESLPFTITHSCTPTELQLAPLAAASCLLHRSCTRYRHQRLQVHDGWMMSPSGRGKSNRSISVTAPF